MAENQSYSCSFLYLKIKFNTIVIFSIFISIQRYFKDDKVDWDLEDKHKGFHIHTCVPLKVSTDTMYCYCE